MIYYICREPWYKSLLPLNEEGIFENVSLVVVKMKSGKHEISHFIISLYFLFILVF